MKYSAVALIALLSAACTANTPSTPTAIDTRSTAGSSPAALPLTPVLSVDPASPVVGTTATLTATADQATLPAVYFWTFGDGYSTSTDGNRVEHVYAGTGVITSAVRVTDITGRTGSAATVVTVQEKPVATIPGDPPPPPKPAPPRPVFALALTCSTTVLAYSNAFCDAKPTLDGQSAVALFRHVDWDFGDGVTATSNIPGLIVNHSYSQGGRSYTVRVTVELTTGDRATATASIYVG